MEREGKGVQLTGTGLHILAMALMLLDHIWGTFPGAAGWLTCAGRLAFPIFAFLLAEGSRHTRDVKRYMLRLLVFALLSEVPFDLMYEGAPLEPFHQNVLWTFLIALWGMTLMERAKKTGKGWVILLADTAVIAGTYLLAVIAFTDYNGPGVLTVYVFYFLHERKWTHFAGQLLLLGWINLGLIQGYFYPVTLGGLELELPRQGLALLALVPIWLYRGEQGRRSTAFRWFCYAFYPVHAMLLYLAAGR